MPAQRFVRVLGISLAAVISMFTASGATYDLTAGGTALITGAIYTTSNSQSTGTGVINSFVRVQARGTEQGYNTDARPLQLDENNSPQFTRSLLLSDVPVVAINGVGYREFLLDINQTSASPLLTLNEVQIWQRTAGDLKGFTAGGCTTSNCFATGFNSGTKVYGLDSGATAAGDNNVVLNYFLNSGSGSGDLFLYVLNSAFNGAGQYVYLYSRFGGGNPANAGFEEWAVRTVTASTVPEPTSVLLLGTAIAGVALWMRRRTAFAL